MRLPWGQTEIGSFLLSMTTIIMLLIAGIVYFVVQYRRRRLMHDKEKKILDDQHKAELLSSQLEIQQQTMQHIGREIHDNVGQKLTLASLYALRLGHNNRDAAINEPLTSISNLINESLTELRKLSENLTDNDLLTAGIEGLIKKECDKINTLGECRAAAIFTGLPMLVSLPVKTIVLRVLQEFMQNSLKHAACREIIIEIENQQEGLKIFIADDGGGFDTAAPGGKGNGLKNMQKRAEMIGADFLLRSEKEKGTSLRIFIPIHQLNL
jgi:signal transduction histidine kinase